MTKMIKKYAGLLERALWTAVQAGVGLVTVEALELPQGWVPAVALGLAVLKGIIAKKVGNKNSYATLPASLDK